VLRLAKIFVIASVFIFADYYLIKPAFSLRIISIAILVVIFLADKLVILKERIYISEDTKKVLIVSFFFLFYIYISDSIKNDFIEATNQFLPGVLLPLILIIFEYRLNSSNLYKILYGVFSISFVWAISQIVGFGENLNTIFQGIGILQSHQIIDPATQAGSRVSGAIFSVIGFANYLGIFIIITYFKFLESKKKILIPAMLIMAIVLFFTQTRAALYGIVPSIAVIQCFHSRKKIKEILRIIAVMLLIMCTLWLFNNTIEKKFSRITTISQPDVLLRFQVNYYLMKGVWKEAPLFGIPKESAWELLYESAAISIQYLGDTSARTPTHHNQIGYYFRYYGLIGLILLLALYFMIFRKIAHTSFFYTKMMLMSIFLFDFQYSMSHNTKLISNILLWILLALAVKEKNKKDETSYSTAPNLPASSENNSASNRIKQENPDKNFYFI